MPENWFIGFCLISIFIISPFLFLVFNALLSNATEKANPLWKRVFAWAGIVLIVSFWVFCLLSVILGVFFSFTWKDLLLGGSAVLLAILFPWALLFSVYMVLFFVGTIHEGNKALLRPYHYLLAILSFAFLIVLIYLWASQ